MVDYKYFRFSFLFWLVSSGRYISRVDIDCDDLVLIDYIESNFSFVTDSLPVANKVQYISNRIMKSSDVRKPKGELKQSLKKIYRYFIKECVRIQNEWQLGSRMKKSFTTTLFVQ